MFFPHLLKNTLFFRWQEPQTKKSRPRAQASSSLQRKTIGTPRSRVQARQILERVQTNGALKSTSPHGSPDQNLVPEPKNQMEETVDFEAQNCSKARFVPWTDFRPRTSYLFAFEPLFLWAAKLRFYSSDFAFIHALISKVKLWSKKLAGYV